AKEQRKVEWISKRCSKGLGHFDGLALCQRRVGAGWVQCAAPNPENKVRIYPVHSKQTDPTHTDHTHSLTRTTATLTPGGCHFTQCNNKAFTAHFYIGIVFLRGGEKKEKRNYL